MAEEKGARSAHTYTLEEWEELLEKGPVKIEEVEMKGVLRKEQHALSGATYYTLNYHKKGNAIGRQIMHDSLFQLFVVAFLGNSTPLEPVPSEKADFPEFLL